MTANKHGVVYSGEYHCEGHNLSSAIELQEKYIKLGYDKIS